MPSVVGMHLGAAALSVVEIDGRDRVRDAFEVGYHGGEGSWRGTEDQIAALIDAVRGRISMAGAIVALSVPAAMVWHLRLTGEEAVSGDAEALAYAAEPHLPLTLDQLHLVTEAGPAAVSVFAVRLHPLGDLLEAFDAAGWVCPVATCDAWLTDRWVRRAHDLTGERSFVATVGRHDASVTVSEDGAVTRCRPLTCTTTRGDDSSARLLLDLQATWHAAAGAGTPEGIVLTDAGTHSTGSAWPPTIRALSPEELMGRPDATVGMVHAKAAADLLGDRRVAGANLRVGSWSSRVIRRGGVRAWTAHSVAAGVALLLLSGVLIWQGQRMAASADAQRAVSRQAWAMLYPDTPPPIDVQGRLISELAKERGVRQGDGQAPTHEPALDLLRDLLASLPREVPLQVRQMDIGEGMSVVQGEARSHGEVEQLAGQITAHAGVSVLPASTERTHHGTVRFTMRFERKEQGNG